VSDKFYPYDKCAQMHLLMEGVVCSQSLLEVVMSHPRTLPPELESAISDVRGVLQIEAFIGSYLSRSRYRQLVDWLDFTLEYALALDGRTSTARIEAIWSSWTAQHQAYINQARIGLRRVHHQRVAQLVEAVASGQLTRAELVDRLLKGIAEGQPVPAPQAEGPNPLFPNEEPAPVPVRPPISRRRRRAAAAAPPDAA
jgi:hypothetical protein